MKKSTEIKAGSLSWRLFSRLLSAGSLCPSPLARATQRWTCSHTIKQVACSLLHYLCLGLCLGIKFYDTWKKWFNRTGAKLNVRGSVFPEYYWTSPKQELKRNYFFRFFFYQGFFVIHFPLGETRRLYSFQHKLIFSEQLPMFVPKASYVKSGKRISPRKLCSILSKLNKRLIRHIQLFQVCILAHAFYINQ